MLMERRYGGCDGGNSRRDADRNRQHVVEEQRRPGRESRNNTQVVLGNRIVAASGGIGVDALAIGDDQNHQQPDDDDRGRNREGQNDDACPHQGQHHGFGRVGHRGERVGSEDSQRRLLA